MKNETLFGTITLFLVIFWPFFTISFAESCREEQEMTGLWLTMAVMVLQTLIFIGILVAVVGKVFA